MAQYAMHPVIMHMCVLLMLLWMCVFVY